MGKQRTWKRQDRHGRAVAGPPPPAPRAASKDPSARAATPVSPEPASGRWSVPTAFMFAATVWSCYILWRALFRWDETAIGSTGGERPWLLPVTIAASGLCSFAAFWLLREGSTNMARLPLWLAVLTGIQGILVTACALICLWLLWYPRLMARLQPDGSVPATRRTRRG